MSHNGFVADAFALVKTKDEMGRLVALATQVKTEVLNDSDDGSTIIHSMIQHNAISQDGTLRSNTHPTPYGSLVR